MEFLMHGNVIHMTILTYREGKDKENYMVKTSTLTLGGKILTLSKV